MTSTSAENKPRVLVTGANGLLGWNVTCEAARAGYHVTAAHRSKMSDWHTTGVRRPRPCDLTEIDLHAMLAKLDVDWVIHCAAAANAHDVEQHPKTTAIINVDVPRRLSAIAGELGVHFVQVSTDLVFDGRDAPYDEQAAVSPLSEYGRQKAEAEASVLRNGGAVCRLPLLLGAVAGELRGALGWLVNTLADHGATLFVDEFRSPLAAPTAARGLLRVAAERSGGVWHLAGQRCSRWQLGELVAAAWKIAAPKMTPAKQADVELPAPRPADVTLSCQRATLAGFSSAPLESQLREVRQSLADRE